MKITIVHEDLTVSLDSPNVVTLDNALQLIDQALRGLGFYFDGTVGIVEED